jgi:hypothetical protein
MADEFSSDADWGLEQDVAVVESELQYRSDVPWPSMQRIIDRAWAVEGLEQDRDTQAAGWEQAFNAAVKYQDQLRDLQSKVDYLLDVFHRESHNEINKMDGWPSGHCNHDGEPWPCTTAQVLTESGLLS